MAKFELSSKKYKNGRRKFTATLYELQPPECVVDDVGTKYNKNGITFLEEYAKKQLDNIKATSFPKAFTVYGDTYMKTTDDDILPYLFKAYKAVPQSNMSLSFANNGDPGTVTITCDLMTDDDGNIIDLTLLPEEENQGE